MYDFRFQTLDFKFKSLAVGLHPLHLISESRV
jgi:hypothetical protein